MVTRYVNGNGISAHGHAQESQDDRTQIPDRGAGVSPVDWLIVGAYVVTALVIGLYFAKRAAPSTAHFFVAGRSLPWFVAGTSMVATTFSADTPLAVAGLSRQSGIYENWFWWSAAIGQLATVFFFARLWRRTGLLTDIEFLVLRYEPSTVRSALRIFKVVFDGILVNCIIMASVTFAMAKVIQVLLDLSPTPLFSFPLVGGVTSTALVLFLLAGTAVLYASLSGLYGVVYTDLIQFGLAMIGSIGLAAMTYIDAAGDAGIVAKLAAVPDFNADFLRFFPDITSFDLLTMTFMVYIFVTWWQYAPGNGYFVQRLLATRSENDAFLAFLWYNLCHYVVCSWPWIFVGLLSLHYLPQLDHPESAFPEMIDLFLPVGLKGIMVASLLAAFMSTLDTHLN